MYDHSTRNDGQNGSYEYCGTNNFDEVDYLYRIPVGTIDYT